MQRARKLSLFKLKNLLEQTTPTRCNFSSFLLLFPQRAWSRVWTSTSTIEILYRVLPNKTGVKVTGILRACNKRLPGVMNVRTCKKWTSRILIVALWKNIFLWLKCLRFCLENIPVFFFLYIYSYVISPNKHFPWEFFLSHWSNVQQVQ